MVLPSDLAREMLRQIANTFTTIRKLSTMVGDLAIAGSYELRNISLPALSTINGAIYLDGDFDQYVYSALGRG